jgi:hypothetical protein
MSTNDPYFISRIRIRLWWNINSFSNGFLLWYLLWLTLKSRVGRARKVSHDQKWFVGQRTVKALRNVQFSDLRNNFGGFANCSVLTVRPNTDRKWIDRSKIHPLRSYHSRQFSLPNSTNFSITTITIFEMTNNSAAAKSPSRNRLARNYLVARNCWDQIKRAGSKGKEGKEERDQSCGPASPTIMRRLIPGSMLPWGHSRTSWHLF